MKAQGQKRTRFTENEAVFVYLAFGRHRIPVLLLEHFPPGNISFVIWFCFVFSKSNSVSEFRIDTGKSELYFTSFITYEIDTSLAHYLVIKFSIYSQMGEQKLHGFAFLAS